jgi:hypothetical protein
MIRIEETKKFLSMIPEILERKHIVDQRLKELGINYFFK